MTTIREHLDKAVEAVLDEQASLLERIDILRKQRDDAQDELRDTRKSNADMYAELEKTRKEATADLDRHAGYIEEMQGVIDGLTKKLDDVNELRSTRKSNADMFAAAVEAHAELDKNGVAKCDGDLPRRIRSMFGLLQLTQQQKDGAVQELERIRSAGKTEYLIHAHIALNEACAPMWPNQTVPERIRALGKERDAAVAAERATATQRDMARNALSEYKEAVKNAMAFLEEVNEDH